jgi:ABC-type transport system substrate-binding protein
VDSPDSAGDDSTIFGCQAKLNYNTYCDARVSKYLDAAVREVDAARRNAYLNRADTVIAQDIPLLPLYPKPGYAIYNRRIKNVV